MALTTRTDHQRRDGVRLEYSAKCLMHNRISILLERRAVPQCYLIPLRAEAEFEYVSTISGVGTPLGAQG